MGNSPSITGLDMGGAHGRRDIVRDGLRTEQRRARFQADESDIELAEELTDEYSGDESSVPESNRKSRVDNAPNPSFGYMLHGILYERHLSHLSLCLFRDLCVFF